MQSECQLFMSSVDKKGPKTREKPGNYRPPCAIFCIGTFTFHSLHLVRELNSRPIYFLQRLMKSEQMSKTFYLETFGCQMNAHDSEKVVGTLQQRGLYPGGRRSRRRPDPLQHLLHPRQGGAEGLSPAERVQEDAGRREALRRARLRRPAGGPADLRARPLCFACGRLGQLPQPARDAAPAGGR